ncbi:hypothetical protein D3C86_1661380 [compost metagenome]
MIRRVVGGASRCQAVSCSGYTASPPMITLFSPAGTCTRPARRATTHSFQKAVGRSSTLIASCSSPSTKAPIDSSNASVRSTRVAPALRLTKTSSMLASKLNGANCSMRSVAATP